LSQLAVGQLAQVEQNLEFARDLQKNITQICNEVSVQAMYTSLVTGFSHLAQKSEFKPSNIEIRCMQLRCCKEFAKTIRFAVTFSCFS